MEGLVGWYGCVGGICVGLRWCWQFFVQWWCGEELVIGFVQLCIVLKMRWFFSVVCMVICVVLILWILLYSQVLCIESCGQVFVVFDLCCYILYGVWCYGVVIMLIMIFSVGMFDVSSMVSEWYSCVSVSMCSCGLRLGSVYSIVCKCSCMGGWCSSVNSMKVMVVMLLIIQFGWMFVVWLNLISMCEVQGRLVLVCFRMMVKCGSMQCSRRRMMVEFMFINISGQIRVGMMVQISLLKVWGCWCSVVDRGWFCLMWVMIVFSVVCVLGWFFFCVLCLVF